MLCRRAGGQVTAQAHPSPPARGGGGRAVRTGPSRAFPGHCVGDARQSQHVLSSPEPLWTHYSFDLPAVVLVIFLLAPNATAAPCGCYVK